MKFTKLSLLTLMAALTAFAVAAPEYTFVDLSNGAYLSRAAGISSNNEVAGWVAQTPSSPLGGFSWSQSGGFTSLGFANGYNEALGNAINSSGIVAGNSQYSIYSSQATYWDNGNPNLIPFASGFGLSRGYGINDNGLVVGLQVSNTDASVGFTYNINTNALTMLGTLSDGAQMGDAFGVNNAGQVVGEAYSANGLDNEGYLYQNGVGQILAPTAGNTDSLAFGISSNGIAVGESTQYSGAYSFGTEWINGVAHAIPNYNGSNDTQYRSVNASGYAVGQDFNSTTALLYDGTNVYDLDSLVLNEPTGFNLQTAFAINDNGWIVGQGSNADGDPSAWLLIPQAVPAPSSLLALGILSLGGLVLVRRNK